MKRLCAALVVIGGLLLFATPAHAGESMSVTGDFRPGGIVTVSGDHCVGTDQSDQQVPGQVTVRIFGGNPVTNVAFTTVVSPPPGDWSVVLEIADTAQPGEQYTVEAGCDRLSVGEPVSFNYPDVVLIMGGSVTPTTETTVAPDTTAGPGAADDPAPNAAAAAAAPTSPRFTG